MAKRRVLIVEDDVLTAMDLEAFVKQEVDADVLLSRSVALAKKLIDPPVDLAFLDVDFTNGKTFEVAVLLKVRQIPFVFLSGSRREHIPEELRDVPFIAKPYNKQQLTEHLRKIIPESPE
jgi:two-component SAPR family response regulator